MGSMLMRPEKRTSELANAMVSPFALTPFTAVMLSMMFAVSDDQLALLEALDQIGIGAENFPGTKRR